MPTKFKQIPVNEKPGLNMWSVLFVAAIALALVLGKWDLLVAVLGLALLITVHEFGHFIAAKAFGMQVQKFYVGFPPAAWKRRRGETEYGVGVIPLGGFCKISGMTPEEEVPETAGERVYWKAPIWKRNVTIFAGPAMNLLAALVILFGALLVQGQAQATLTVGKVVKQTPAQYIGLQPGDRLVGADGERWTSWDQASAFLSKSPGRTIRLTYVPAEGPGAGEERTVAVTLGENPNAKGNGFLGVGPRFERVSLGPARAAWLSLVGLKDVTWGVFYGIYLIAREPSIATGDQGALGVVGIVDVSGEAVRQGWYPILLALLSANLAIINLIPILPFDGGHIFFNVVEKIRGRRVDPRVLERVVAVGVTLLILLFVFLTFNDLQRIFG